MAVAELPLPPFPYEKDFFGSPFPKGGKKSALPIFGKKSNKEKSNGRTRKKIEEILRTFNKAPSPSSENSVQNQAQQNNKQPRQISQKPTNTERTARTSNQTEYKRQAQSSKMDIWFENK